MEANAGKSFQMQIIFNIFSRVSLHCNGDQAGNVQMNKVTSKIKRKQQAKFISAQIS